MSGVCATCGHPASEHSPIGCSVRKDGWCGKPRYQVHAGGAA